MGDIIKYNLTNQQKALYNIDKVYKNSKINNISFWLEINHVINFELLTKAINVIVEKNDNFRFQFVEENGEIYQYAREYTYQNFEILDVANSKELEQKIKEYTFDLENDNLCVFTLFRYPDGKGGIVASAHHQLGDAWTMGIFINEVLDIYHKLLINEDVSDLTYPSYLEYVNTQNEYIQSEKYIKDKEYWEEVFSNNIEKLSFKEESFDINAIREEYEINEEILKDIRSFCSENKISEYVFFLSVFCIYLGKLKGLNNFVIGNPILNRSNFREKCTSGLFMSTMPFVVNIDDELNFIDYAKNIASGQMKMYKHLKYPDYEITKYFNQKNNTHGPIYDFVFSYQNAKTDKDTVMFETKTRWMEAGQQLNSLMIHFKDTEDTGRPILIYDYLSEIFTGQDIDILNKRIMEICKQVLTNIQLADIEIITSEEKQYLVNNCNNTYFEYDRNSTIVSRLEKTISETNNEIALIYGNEKLSYSDLNKQANKLARYMQKLGVKQNDIIPIIDSRSIDMIIGMFAIMKLGCAYLPIDIEYPKDRIEYIISDASAKLVLTRKEYKDRFETSGKKIFIDTNEYEDEQDTNLNTNILPDDLAYLIYTSGSTGKPKGVMLSHRNVVNFTQGTSNIICFKNKTIVSVTTISFDIFVLESWLSLIKGAKVVIANENEQNISHNLNKLCLENNVQMIQTTPSRMKLLISDNENIQFIKNMTDIMIGGEAVPYKLIEDLRKITNARIFNMYGPTETCVWSTIKELTNDNIVTIGKPIANTTVYVLNKNKRLCPIGVAGDLYIGGDGVCKGYYKKQELTNEKFIKNIYNKDEIIYETGDIAKWDNNGNLICLGRNDFQIKINGHRIEIEEVENTIFKYGDITEVAVVSINNQALYGYYTSNKPIDNTKLRVFVAEKLPTYMVPTKFIQIDDMPKTPNGKIDRKKIIAFSNNTQCEQEEIIEPRNEIEDILFKAFTQIIDKKISIDKPFFDYGFDSLSIIKVQTLLLKNKWNITLQDFYKYPTIEQLAKHILNKYENGSKYDNEYEDLPTIRENINNIYISGNKNNYKNILLTGCTGFIGIHVLQELLLNTDANIYCIIRSKNDLSPIYRLEEKLDFYFNGKYKEFIGNRIIVIETDITKDVNIQDKIQDIDLVIHSAALVKHYGDVELFKKVNIQGTQNIINICKKYNSVLCYLSSLSVSGNYLVKQDNRDKEFTEDNLYIGQRYQDNVYVYSKFECEKLIYNEIKNGLKASVYRIGIVSGRATDGLMQQNISENAFYNRIKAIVDLKNISQNMFDQSVEFTPVDLLAQALVKLVQIPESINKVYHLYNDELFSIKDVLQALSLLDININVLSSKEFDGLIKQISSNINENSKLGGVINDFYNTDEGIGLNYDFTINIRADKTKKYLEKLGFKWINSKFEKEIYLRKIFRYMRNVNYI